jgi:two-component system nitrate/nitrite response regulator NarL
MSIDPISVSILDDHQSIIDGYLYRLSNVSDIKVVATISFGEELKPTLAEHSTDVLLLDINVPTSSENPNPYPILHSIPSLLQKYPELSILIISMYAERGLIRAVMEAGASGYVLKDDNVMLRDIGSVIRSIANGGIYFSQKAHQLLLSHRATQKSKKLSPRQLEVLSICASYPDWTSATIANKLSVANSTVRNLLSSAYIRLGVHNRAAAVVKARQLGLISPDPPSSLQELPS